MKDRRVGEINKQKDMSNKQSEWSVSSWFIEMVWDGLCLKGKRGEGLRRGGAEDRRRGGMRERGVWREAQVCVTGKRRKLGRRTAIRGCSGVSDIGLHMIGCTFFSVIVTCNLIIKRDRASDVGEIYRFL